MSVTKIYRTRPANCHCTHARRSHKREEWLGAPEWLECRYCDCIQYHAAPAPTGATGGAGK